MAQELRVIITGDSAGLERALGRSTGAVRGFGSATTRMAKDVVKAFIGLEAAMGIGAYESIKAAAKFQTSMQLIHTQAGVTQKAVDQMSKGILGMAHSVGTAPDQLSQSMFHLASMGLRGAKAMDALKIAAEGAKVGQADLVSVTNAVGAVLVSNIKGSKDFNQVMGALNATVGAGDMHMQDLADALGTGLAAKAALARVSLRDVSAALAVLGDNQIRGAEAGTLLASSLRIMAGPSKAASKELATVGLSGEMIAKKMQGPGGLVSAIQLIRDHIKNIPASELPTFINRAFGGRQSGGVQILIDQLGRLETKVKAVGAGSNSFSDAWETTKKNTSFQLDQIRAGLDVLAIQIGNKLLPKVNEVVGWINAHWPEISRVIGEVATAVGTTISTLVAFIRAHWSQISAVFDAVKNTVVTAVTWMTDEVRSHWQQISTYAMTIFNGVKDIITGVVNVIRALWAQFGSSLEAIARNTWNTIKTVIGAELNVIKGIVNVFAGLLHGDWSRVWEGIKQITSGLLSGIVAIIRGAVGNALAAAQAVGAAILHAFVAAWNAVKKAVSSGITTVVAWMQSLPGRIVGALGDLSGLLVGAGKKIIQGLIRGAKSLVNKVKDFFTGLASDIVSWKGPPAKDATLLTEAGHLIMHSLVKGITETIGDVKNAVDLVTGAIVNPLNDPAVKAEIAVASRVLGAGAVKGITDGIMGVQQSMQTQLITAMKQAVHQAIVAAAQQVATDKGTLASALSSLGSNIMSAAGALGPNFGTASTRALTGKAAAEAAANAAQQTREQQAQLQRAIDAANKQLAADTASGASADQIAQDKQAIADAVQQMADFQAAQQQAADQKAADAAQKRDRDNLEKQWSALEKEIQAHPERAAKIRAQIDKLLAKYGITPSSVMAATDWQTAQTLFIASLGDVVTSMQTLTAAIDKLADLNTAARTPAAPPSGGLPHHAAGGATKAGLAVLHDGEYVLNPSITRKIGIPALNRLNFYGSFAKGGPINPHTGGPDTPLNRASAMFANDWGEDKWDPDTATALIGAIGPRAQLQAALRPTTINLSNGSVSLRRGVLGRGMGSGAFAKLLGQFKTLYPDIDWDPGTPGQNIGALPAVSRLPMQGQELGALLMNAHNGVQSAIDDLAKLTSYGIHKAGAPAPTPMGARFVPHAGHGDSGASPGSKMGDWIPGFKTGGIMPWDGLAYLHKNETVIPAGAGSRPVHLHATIELDGQKVGRHVQQFLIDEDRFGRPGLSG